MGVNRVILLGHVGADPEVQHFEGSNRVRARFRFATTEYYKDRQGQRQEQTEWHTVIFWGAICRTIEEHVRKGQQLYIEGRIRYRQWLDEQQQKHYVTEIVGDTFQFAGPRREGLTDPPSAPEGGQLSEANGEYTLPGGEDFPF